MDFEPDDVIDLIPPVLAPVVTRSDGRWRWFVLVASIVTVALIAAIGL